ncbi:MAG: hypothetical protein IPP90_16420 [Gemmatimonadaceae bacterium]|nr:hypothetical protein [Gemmatimonadaceae bacterium]
MTRSIDVDALCSPLLLDEDVEEVTIDVHCRNRSIGTLVLPVYHGTVGIDRLLDTIVDRLGETLILADWRETVRSTKRHLVALSSHVAAR